MTEVAAAQSFIDEGEPVTRFCNLTPVPRSCSSCCPTDAGGPPGSLAPTSFAASQSPNISISRAFTRLHAEGLIDTQPQGQIAVGDSVALESLAGDLL